MQGPWCTPGHCSQSVRGGEGRGGEGRGSGEWEGEGGEGRKEGRGKGEEREMNEGKGRREGMRLGGKKRRSNVNLKHSTHPLIHQHPHAHTANN